MQNWFYVQSAEYGEYYIEVDVNGYGTYHIWIGMLYSDGFVGSPVDELTTSNKSFARRKYNKFIQDAETDSYGWNSNIGNPTWKFNTNTSLRSVQEYILSNPKNIKASSNIRMDSNMKKYVKASTDSSVRSGIIDAIDRASNTNPNVGATTWYELAETSDKIWAFVCAWLDLDGDGEYRLMGKIAYMSTRSAMSDYDYDWMMPELPNGDVADTELEIDPNGDIDYDVDWWVDRWEEMEKIYVYPEEDYDEDIESATKINCVGHNDPGRYFDLIDYFDVWGNEEDGWVVNNLGPIEEKIWISDDITEEELFNYLKDTIGYFNKNTKLSDVIIEWNDPDFIEFFQADNYYPLGRLQKSYTK